MLLQAVVCLLAGLAELHSACFDPFLAILTIVGDNKEGFEISYFEVILVEMNSGGGSITMGNRFTSSGLRRLLSVACASAVLLGLFGGPVGSASAIVTEPSTLNVDGLVLPEGISVTLVEDYSKVPNVSTEGTKAYSCIAIYLVSSLSVPTFVHVSGLSLAAEEGGESILYGGQLSGYLRVQPNTLNSAYLPSSQALGRLSPGGYFASPLAPRQTASGDIPNVLNCQSASIGRMFGLTVMSKMNYLVNNNLYLTGQVDIATPSTYDVSGVTTPEPFTPTLNYLDAEGYSVSCITRDGRNTTIGVALKYTTIARRFVTTSSSYIARNITIDGVEYPSPGIPNLRTPCVPVAVIPNDEMGDVTGDRAMTITADIVRWPGKVFNRTRLVGTSKMAKWQLGIVDRDSVAVTYDLRANRSFVWFTAKARTSLASLAKCTSTTFSYAKLSGTYVANGQTLASSLLVRSSIARKYPSAIASSQGTDTYAVLSFPGNVFTSDGTLTITGDVTATDRCS